jgi:hydrophobic/amphiphilic exporter-1 (mainly G- bacteria), HAE1 family
VDALSNDSERPKREGFFAFVTDRPVAVLMLMTVLAVFGAVSLDKLPVDLLPEISYPTLTVRTTYRGAAPQDVEDRVSVRLQESLSTLPHLVRSTSISRAETSDVVLEFDWGTSMTFAVQDVRDKLDGVFLPQGTERPLILRYDPNLDPILRIGLTSSDARAGEDRVSRLVHLRWLAEKRIQRDLEAIPGIAAVQVRGGLEEEIRVRVDPFAMAAYALDPAALAQRLASENINASGGLIREGSTEYLVRTLNEFQTVGEIEKLAVARRGDATIRVEDVAEVERTFAEREVVSRIGGNESVEIAIYREAGANIVELADEVRRRVFGTEEQRKAAEQMERDGARGAAFGQRERTDFLAWRYREDARFEVLSDQSTFIRDAVDDVKSSALVGSLLTVLVILAFLRHLASTAIIAVTIPLSVIVTFAPMYLGDVSMNIMSLGGLALGVGMLLDNSIVVLESIARCREEGDSLRIATIRGTREVAGAMTASTLTTVSVFAPIVFVHGIAGQIFGDQAMTVVASQIISLGVGVVFIPMLASRPMFAGEGAAAVLSKGDARLALLEGLEFKGGRALRSTVVLAGRVLAWPFRGVRHGGADIWLALLRSIGRVALAAGLLVVLALLAVLLVALRVSGWVLAPLRWLFDLAWRACDASYGRILQGALAAPALVVGGTVALFLWSASSARQLGLELLPEIHQGEFTVHVGLPVGTPLEQTDAVLSELDAAIRARPEVEVTALTVGVENDTLTREIEGKHTARLTVRLKQQAAIIAREDELVAEIRQRIASHPAVRSVDVTRPTPFALDAPIEVEVLGHDLERMREVAGRIVERLSQMPELSDVRSSARSGHPELRVTFDRDKTLEYGLDLMAVSNLVRDQVLGNVSTRFSDGEEKIDVRVRGDEVILGHVERVMHLVVNPSAPKPVELGAVASIEPIEGPAEIRRIGNTRAIVVSAAGRDLDLGGLASRIESKLADLQVPDDVAVEIGGQKREMDTAQSSMRGALLLALFLVYVVMACQFESLLQPLVILLSVPLAMIGVVWTLLAFDLPLSVVVFIGLILLAGIVVNNAIVLLDRINQNRAGGVPLREAVVEAGRTRLRPILMTATASVMGLLPMTGWLEPIPWIGTLGAGQGAEIRAPMAITVVAGLIVSTALTLIVIPVVYTATEGWLERLRGRGAAA